MPVLYEPLSFGFKISRIKNKNFHTCIIQPLRYFTGVYFDANSDWRYPNYKYVRFVKKYFSNIATEIADKDTPELFMFIFT